MNVIRTAQRTALVLPLALSSLLAAGAASAGADRVRAEGPLTSYDATQVPAGAWARVQSVATPSDATVITLHVRGLLPNEVYGAHAHVSPCGSTGGAAGPHYQDVVAPSGQAAEAAYANPENEVWLDLTTDGEGNGSAQARVPWHFRANGANSVVLHALATSTGAGTSGVAGARVGCLSIDF